eukprot:scaffold202201_cov37-Tisochrysis_lutea.AAC.2
MGRPPARSLSKTVGHSSFQRHAIKPAHPRRRISAGTSFGNAERKNSIARLRLPSGDIGTSSADDSKYRANKQIFCHPSMRAAGESSMRSAGKLRAWYKSARTSLYGNISGGDSGTETSRSQQSKVRVGRSHMTSSWKAPTSSFKEPSTRYGSCWAHGISDNSCVLGRRGRGRTPLGKPCRESGRAMGKVN